MRKRRRWARRNINDFIDWVTNLHQGYHLGDSPDPLYAHRRVKIENDSRPGISTNRPRTARVAVSIAKRPFRSTGSLSSYPGVSEDTFLPSSPTRSTAVVEFIEVSCGRFLMSVPQKKAALPIRRPRGPRSTGREAEFWFVRRPCERGWWHASLRQGSRLRCVRRRPRSRCWASG